MGMGQQHARVSANMHVGLRNVTCASELSVTNGQIDSVVILNKKLQLAQKARERSGCQSILHLTRYAQINLKSC